MEEKKFQTWEFPAEQTEKEKLNNFNLYNFPRREKRENRKN